MPQFVGPIFCSTATLERSSGTIFPGGAEAKSIGLVALVWRASKTGILKGDQELVRRRGVLPAEQAQAWSPWRKAAPIHERREGDEWLFD